LLQEQRLHLFLLPLAELLELRDDVRVRARRRWWRRGARAAHVHFDELPRSLVVARRSLAFIGFGVHILLLRR